MDYKIWLKEIALYVIINKMVEIYKKIEGHNNYEVSNFGNVKNVKTGRILKAGINRDGYYNVVLYDNGKAKSYKLHRLVAEAFIDNPDNKLCVDHINNIKTDNNITNLRYATHSENNQNKTISKNNTSNVKGVTWHKNAKKWMAHIQIDGIKIHLGYFDEIEEAKQARINRANQAFGMYKNACEQ